MPRRRFFHIKLLWLFLLLSHLPCSYAGALPAMVDGQPLPSLAPMLERIMPSVVNITTESSQAANGEAKDPFFKRFLDKNNRNKETPFDGTGSGVIIHGRLGHILTNYHVIENAKVIIVTLSDGRRYEAAIIGIDPRADLAIIGIDANNLTAIRFGDSDSLQVGDFVVAIGNPYGIGQSVTSGIVSALHRNLGIGEYENFIQTDASINLGNSGGALINLRGELIGVNTAILGGQSGGNIGIGFAIPVNTAANVIDQIVRFGGVRRGELGIEVRDIDDQTAKRIGLVNRDGALISNVFANSAAARASLAIGDIIINVNGQDIFRASDVKNLIGNMQPGTQIEITYLRDGIHYLIKVVLPAEQPR